MWGGQIPNGQDIYKSQFAREFSQSSKNLGIYIKKYFLKVFVPLIRLLECYFNSNIRPHFINTLYLL